MLNRQKIAPQIFKTCRLFVVIWMLLLVGFSTVSAQLYPVTTTITPGGMALPPYLHQWIDPTEIASPIQIAIQFNDLNNEPIIAGLRVSISGQGVSLVTNTGTPVLLDLVPGQITLLEPSVLAQLFATGRLSGAQRLGSQQPLPEGIYTICLEVYDLRRNVVISNPSCGVFAVQNFDVPEWLMLQPSAELPTAEFSLGRVDHRNAQVLTFGWSPRHPPVLMAEYTFEIFEYPGDGRSEYAVPPDQLVHGLLPYFSTTTSATSYLYTLNDPILEPDKIYIARLKVSDPMGTYLFVNQGVGPVGTFQLFDANQETSSPCLDPSNRPKLTLDSWDAASAFLSWTVEDDLPYKELIVQTLGPLDEDWHLQTELDPSSHSYELSLGAQQIQQMRIGVRCQSATELVYSNVVSFSRFPEVLPDNCELPIDPSIVNQSPLELTLSEGDSVMVGDFVLVMEYLVDAGPPYSGEGYVVTPLFNLFRPRVATMFRNLEINSDFQVVSGLVETVQDPKDGLTIDLDGLSGLFRSMHAFDDLNYEIHNISDSIKQIYLNSDGEIEIIILDADGREIITTYPLSLEPVQDIGIGLHRDGYEHAGDVFLENTSSTPTTFIGPDGVIYGLIGSSLFEESDRLSRGDPTNLGSKGTVQFSNHPKAAGGLDAPNDSPSQEEYEVIAPNYQMGWKAIRHGTSDSVRVDISDADVDSLFFETHSGYSLRYKLRGHEITLHIPSRSEGDADGVYALGRDVDEDQDHTLGGLKIASYPLDVYTLNVIPINGAINEIDLVALATDLNKIYNPAIVSWQIKVHPNQEVNFNEDEDPRLATGKGTTGQYNRELRNIVSALQKKLELEKSTKDNPVLNIVVVPELDAENNGYMPLSRDWGFVEPLSQNRGASEISPFSRLIAHELGHGAFALRHSWEQYPDLAKGTTTNLMDYGSGIALTKRQWDQIHDPSPVLGFMETGSGAAGISDPIYFCVQGVDLSDFANRCFVDPDGQSVMLPQEVTQIAFYAKEDSDEDLVGRLASFRVDGKRYSVSLMDGAFNGYHNYDNRTEFFLPSGSCESGELVIGSTEDCQYSVGNDSEQQEATDCDCNWDQNSKPEITIDICDLLEGGELNEEDVARAGAKLTELVTVRAGIQGQIRPKGTFHHIGSTNGESIPMPRNELQILDERLFLLKYHTGIDFFVVFTEVREALSKTSAQEFATQVSAQARQLSSNAVVITVPFSNTANGPVLTTCGYPAYASTISLTPSSAPVFSVFEFALRVFSEIEKPLNLASIVLLSDGSVLEVASRTEEAISGYQAINVLEVYDTKSRAQIKEHLLQRPAFEVGKSGYSTASDFIKKYEAWAHKLDELRHQGLEQEMSAINASELESLLIPITNPVALRESYAADEGLRTAYAYYLADDLDNWIKATVEEARGKYAFDDSEHLYDEITLHEIAYGAIDALTLILAPSGLDILGDATGLLYTLVFDRASGIKYLEYSAGLVIPFAIDKIARGSTQGFKVVRSLKKGAASYRVEHLSTIIPDHEDWIFSIRGAQSLQDADRMLNSQLSKLDEVVEGFYDKCAQVFDQLVDVDVSTMSKISSEILNLAPNLMRNQDLLTKELAEAIIAAGANRPSFISQLATLDDGTLAALAKNLGGRSDLAKAIGGNEGGLSSWKVVKDGPLEFRTNIEVLEIFDDHVKYLGSNYLSLKAGYDSASDKILWLDDATREIRSIARSIPGTTSGHGKVINGKWLKGTEGNAGQFPSEIADLLSGKDFQSFDAFRIAFWKAISEHSVYGPQFASQNIVRMKQGLAPYAKNSQHLGAQKSYILHHNKPIYLGGSVYDLENLTIVTPRYHKEILSPSYHYGK